MRERSSLSRALVFVGLISIVMGGAVLAQGREVTVAGMLVGFDEDDDGNFQRVYLQEPNLGAILVVNDETGKKLLKLAGTQVEATGMLDDLDDPDFSMQIRVTSYRPLP